MDQERKDRISASLKAWYKNPENLAAKVKKIRQSRDLAGHRFGNLVVLRMVSPKELNRPSKNYLCECLCDCGKQLVVQKNLLEGCATRKPQRQCVDCRNRTAGARNQSKRRPDTAIRHLFRTYQKRIQKKGMDFDLSLDEFRKLTSSSCQYCGDPATNIFRRHNRSLLYNGIDRVDNTLGYTRDNSVPCCKNCNQAKNDLPLSVFLDLASKIHARRFPRITISDVRSWAHARSL